MKERIVSSDTSVAIEPSEDYLRFMQMLEEGKHLELFPDETPPPGETGESLKKKALEISNKFPFKDVP